MLLRDLLELGGDRGHILGASRAFCILSTSKGKVVVPNLVTWVWLLDFDQGKGDLCLLVQIICPDYVALSRNSAGPVCCFLQSW